MNRKQKINSKVIDHRDKKAMRGQISNEKRPDMREAEVRGFARMKLAMLKRKNVKSSNVGKPTP